MDLTFFQNTIFFTLFLTASGHSLYLSGLLLFKSVQEKGLEWLGVMMVPTSLWLLVYFFYLGDIMRSNPNLLGVLVPFIYLIGPAYYFFIRKSTNPESQIKWIELLHLAPVLFVLWEWVPLYMMSTESKLAIIEHAYVNHKPSLFELLMGSRNEFIVLAYVVSSYIYLKRRISQKSMNALRVQWLINFTLCFGIVIFLKTSIMTLAWTLDWSGVVLELLMVLLMSSAVHLLGYVVLGKDKVLPDLLRAEVYHQKYASSPLDEVQINNYKDQILDYFRTSRPWLDAGFSINDLVSAIGIPRHYVSQVLNEGFQKGFYDINCQYRIEEVKRLLLTDETDKFSIQGIASNCGFKSKSSFHRAFKKETGMTPGDFIRYSKMVEANL